MGHKKRKRRSTKIVVILIVAAICVVASAAFIGVQLLSNYKDNMNSDNTTTASQPSTSMQTPETALVATVVSMFACETCGHVLVVGLRPTALAKADYQYKVDLFEKGRLRQTSSITWNQLQIDVERAKGVEFDLTTEEWEDYLGRSVNHIFSVSVHE